MPKSSRPPPPPDASSGVTFAFGDFEFDEERWELRRAGAAVDVPPKAMQTIGMLLRNRDRVVSNEELLGTLWFDVAVTEASLLKAIRIARKVLGDDGDAQRIIRTKRGRGYRFVADVRETRPRRSVLPPPPWAGADEPVRSDPFLGRSAELAELRGALARALDGRGSFVLLSGDAGTGKTRLAEVFVASATELGARVLWGRTSEAGGAPELWPFVQIARSLSPPGEPIAGASLEDMARLASSHGEPSSAWPLFQDEAARFRFFDAIAFRIRRQAEQGPLVLVLEDLHGADAATLALLAFLAREIADAGVVLVGTFRPEEGIATTDSMARLVREARSIALSGLSAEDSRELLAYFTGARVDAAFAARVHRITEGNPLFIEEIARLSSSAPRQLEATEIPERVAEIVRGRLRALGEDTRELLSIAAVIGRDFDVPLLERASGLSKNAVFLRLEPALARRIVTHRVGSMGECQFAQALFRDVLYEDLGIARRAEVHRAVAEALEAWAFAGEEPPVALLSHHFFRAALGGGSEKAARYAVAAGDAALRAFAYEDAARHYEQALEASRSDTSLDPVRADISTSLGHALRLSGDFPRASACFERSVELSRALGDAVRIARAALGFAAVHPETGSVNHEVIRLLEEVGQRLDRIPPDAAEASEARELESMVLARLSTSVSLAGQVERADDYGERALVHARSSGRPLALSRALQARHWGSAWKPGTARERLAMAEEMIALARAGGDASLGSEGRIGEITDLLELGRRDGFDLAVAEYARAAETHRDSSALYNVRLFDTTIALLEGRFEEAERLAQVALPIGARLFEDNARNFFTAQLFWIRFEQGRARELEGLLRASVDSASGSSLLGSVLARLNAEAGEEDVARADLDHVARRDFADIRDDWATLATFTHLSAACEALGDGARARLIHERLVPHATSHAVLGPAIVYLGPVSLALGLCSLACGAVDEAVAWLERAKAHGERMRALPTVARIEYHLAAALARRDADRDAERSRLAAASAFDVAGRLGMTLLAARARALIGS